MKITITLPDYPPAINAPSWEALEAMLKTCYVEERAGAIRFTKIARNDAGVNYRAPGNYTFELGYDPEAKGSINIEQ